MSQIVVAWGLAQRKIRPDQNEGHISLHDARLYLVCALGTPQNRTCTVSHSFLYVYFDRKKKRTIHLDMQHQDLIYSLSITQQTKTIHMIAFDPNRVVGKGQKKLVGLFKALFPLYPFKIGQYGKA